MKRQNLGFIGAGLMGASCFIPLMSIPIMGNICYFSKAGGDWTIVMVLAVITASCFYAEKYKAALIPILLCAGLFIFTYLNISEKVDSMKAGADSNIFTDMLSNAIQFQWGWFILVVSVLVCLFAAIKAPDAD